MKSGDPSSSDTVRFSPLPLNADLGGQFVCVAESSAAALAGERELQGCGPEERKNKEVSVHVCRWHVNPEARWSWR